MRKRIHYIFYPHSKVIPSYRFYVDGKDVGFLTWKVALSKFPLIDYEWVNVSYIHGDEHDYLGMSQGVIDSVIKKATESRNKES